MKYDEDYPEDTIHLCVDCGVREVANEDAICLRCAMSEAHDVADAEAQSQADLAEVSEEMDDSMADKIDRASDWARDEEYFGDRL